MFMFSYVFQFFFLGDVWNTEFDVLKLLCIGYGTRRYSGMVLYFLDMLICLPPTPSHHRQTRGAPFSLFPVGVEVTLFSHARVVTLDSVILFPGQERGGISHNRRATFRTLFPLYTRFGEKARREEQEAVPTIYLRIFLVSWYELQIESSGKQWWLGHCRDSHPACVGLTLKDNVPR